MSGITTHVLDSSAGKPASAVPVKLERETKPGAWELIGQGVTDADGRCRTLTDSSAKLNEGNYRITFDTRAYFNAREIEAFYNEVAITFVVRQPEQHYHVPLLLSPFGYTTYRGS